MNQDLECPYCGHWDEASPDDYIGADPFKEYEHECSHCEKTYLFTAFTVYFNTVKKRASHD